MSGLHATGTGIINKNNRERNEARREAMATEKINQEIFAAYESPPHDRTVHPFHLADCLHLQPLIQNLSIRTLVIFSNQATLGSGLATVSSLPLCPE